ncbi:MAG TPA: hypothetical protein IAA29_04025 [Candidatus Paenibacillus intestinavium]|nr:hypothetical protein [Candidatus Paenibacillus intestinavium]
MQVTINDVRYAVNNALDTAFPDIPVSGEEIKQLLDPPRFFVRLIEPSHTQELGRRYRRHLPFVIRYFTTNNDDCYAMAEKLTSALKWIDVGGQVPGYGMRFQIVDEVLHFFVTYSMFVWEQPPNDPKMQTFEQEGYVNE